MLVAETTTGSTAFLGQWMMLALLGVLGLGLLAVAAAGASHRRERLALTAGTAGWPAPATGGRRPIGAAFGQIVTQFVGHPPGSPARTAPTPGPTAGTTVSNGGASSAAGLAVTVRRVADASGVDASQLRDAALDVQERTRLADVAGDEVEMRRWSEARLAAWSLPVLPVGLAAVMFAAVGGPSGPVGWVLLGLALVLGALGARWIGRLPGSRVAFLLEREREIDDRLQWFDQVTETLDTAQLYAAGGFGGSDALEAAAPVYVAHPVRRLLAGSDAVTGPSYDPSEGVLSALVRDLGHEASPAGTQRLLAGASAQLRTRYQTDLERRVLLTRRGVVVSALGCFGPVVVMVGAAFAL